MSLSKKDRKVITFSSPQSISIEKSIHSQSPILSYNIVDSLDNISKPFDIDSAPLSASTNNLENSESDLVEKPLLLEGKTYKDIVSKAVQELERPREMESNSNEIQDQEDNEYSSKKTIQKADPKLNLKCVWVHSGQNHFPIYPSEKQCYFSDLYSQIISSLNLYPNSILTFKMQSYNGTLVNMSDRIPEHLIDLFIVQPPVRIFYGSIIEDFEQGVSIETISRRFNIKNVNLKRKGSNSIVEPPFLSGEYTLVTSLNGISYLEMDTQKELDFIDNRMDISRGRKKVLKLIVNSISLIYLIKSISILIPKSLYDMIN